MITNTVVTLHFEVNPGVTATELAAIRRFVDIEQDRIAEDFAHVFGLAPSDVKTNSVRMQLGKSKRKRKPLLKRLKRLYGF